jgi:predicted aspartyl protease
MIREARGFYVAEGGPTQAPVIRIGVGFGRDRVFTTPALVDTGSDVCVFSSELVRWPLPEGPVADMLMETAGGNRFPATCYFPAITVGDIRIEGIATVLLEGAGAILGRSFLNLCEVRLSAQDGRVLLRRREPTGG